MTLSRSLPSTWIGTSRVCSTTAVSSTSGQRSTWIELQASPRASARRDHSSSAMCGAAGASIRTSSRTASSHSGNPATDVPRYRNSTFESSMSFATIVFQRKPS